MNQRLSIAFILSFVFIFLFNCNCTQKMAVQGRIDPQSPDGIVLPPADGTVPINGPQDLPQPQLSRKLLLRGKERYEIFCSPCHGALGDGQGIIVSRGFLAPPTYHQPRLRDAPDQYFYEVIQKGYGAMYSYEDRVPSADRWAIIAYIRALQKSQNFPTTKPTPQERQKLKRRKDRS